MKKPLVKTLLSLLLVAVLLVGGTLAYIVANDGDLRNTFRLARITTEIEEPETGTAADKTAVVVNTGDSPAYIRAQVMVSGGDAATADKFTFTYNTSAWTYGGDGYYYYNQILPATDPDSETAALFTNVVVDPTVPQDARFSIDVYQEAVLAPAEAPADIVAAAQAAFAAKG